MPFSMMPPGSGSSIGRAISLCSAEADRREFETGVWAAGVNLKPQGRHQTQGFCEFRESEFYYCTVAADVLELDSWAVQTMSSTDYIGR